MASSIKPHDLLLWMDLETTGDDPEKDYIMEIAAVLTKANFSHPLGFVNGAYPSFQSVVHASHIHIQRLCDTPVVLKMHAETGLLAECASAPLSEYGISLVDERFNHWLSDTLLSVQDYYIGGDTKIYLAGSGVHFDRKFIDRDFPNVSRQLHYSHFDISPMRKFWQLSGRSGWTNAPTIRHRAFDDITDHINEGRFYLKTLGALR